MEAGGQPGMAMPPAPQQTGLSHKLQSLIPPANFESLEDYVYLLYEDSSEQKIQGAKSILRLCLDEPQNLE